VRKALLVVLALALWPVAARAAVNFNSQSASTGQQNVSTVTWPHTLAPGGNLVAILSCAANGATPRTITSAGYGGQAFTQISGARVIQNNNEWADQWVLAGPTGNQTVAVNLSGSTGAIVCGLVVVSGANQAAPIGTAATNAGQGVNASVPVTTVTNDMIVSVINENTANTNGIFTSNGIERWKTGVGTNVMMGATATNTGNGTVTQTWQVNSPNDPWVASGVSVHADSGDVIPPSVPTGLSCAAPRSSVITATWVASTDNVAVDHYDVAFCSPDCTPFTSTAATSVAITGLAAGQRFFLAVQAVDSSGNPSGYTPSQCVVTLPTRIDVVRLHYTDQSADETGFAVFMCEPIYPATSCDPTGPAGLLVTSPAANVVDVTLNDTWPNPFGCGAVKAQKTNAPDSAFSNAWCSNAANAILTVSPSSLSFAGTVGGANPPPQTLTITNSTPTPMPWTIGDNGTIAALVEAPSSGTDTTQITVSVTIGATAGSFSDMITVQAPGAAGSPATIPVTLNVSPSSAPSPTQSGRVR
jgi:hypothetical protein